LIQQFSPMPYSSPEDASNGAKAAIRRFDESLLPVYAIKELKQAYCKVCLASRKLVTTKSWNKTQEQLRKMAMTPYAHDG